jgi:RNA polymerase sigma-70 factor (ECF subfamily)
MAMQVAAPTDAPDVVALKTEFVSTLNMKMAELPPIFQEVLLLRNAKNMSYEQIAAALDCSVGTVKSRIARAREALREAMAGEF